MGRGRPRRSLTSAGGKTSASAPRGAGRLAGAPSISPDLPFFLAVGMRIFMAYLLPVDLARQPLFEIGAAHQRLSSCPAGPTARVVDASNDQNLWMALGRVTRRGAPSRG